MHKMYFLILYCILASFNIFAQTKVLKEISGNVVEDLIVMLPDGTVTAEVMDSIHHDPQKIMIIRKYQAAIQANKDWYLDYCKISIPGKPLPWHQNMGITEPEYVEMNDYISNIEAIPSTSEKVQIFNTNAVIHFSAVGKCALLNNFAISLERKAVRFGKNVMTFTDSIQVKNDRNALRSAWTGYSWKFEDPAPGDPEYVNKIEEQNIKFYQFTKGILEKTGKIFMQIKGSEIREGFREVNFDLPIVFKSMK